MSKAYPVFDSQHADGDDENGRPRTYLPALPTLTRNVRDTRHRLLAGFESRRALLDWEQDLCIRTLGQVPQRFYRDIARSFRSAEDRTLLAVLLRDGVDGVELDREVARQERRRLAATFIVPAFNSAFRHLRPNAKQYVEDGDAGSEHAPEDQPYTAMRPALDELSDYQGRALSALLDGFPSGEAILDWGDDVHLATHGEIPQDFVSRCYTERATRRVLLDATPGAARERELLCAHYVLPHMNAGVRELAKRAGELPTSKSGGLEVPSG